MAFQLISSKEAESLINAGDSVVIDLRDFSEYEKGHIAGALCLPYELLEMYIEKLPESRQYILYCSHGGTSMIAGRQMAEAGLDVLSISGGISSYRGPLFV